MKLIDRLEDIWSETINTQQDAGLDEIKLRLSSNHRSSTQQRGKSDAHVTARWFANLFFSRRLSTRASAAFRGAAKFDLCQYWACWSCFSMVSLMAAVAARYQKPVFMLHDMIPLENPEWVSDASMRHHRRMTENAARYAAALIATTPTARDSLMRELRLRGRSDIQIATVPPHLSRTGGAG